MTHPINHIALTVAELPRSVAFYTGLLGLLGFESLGGAPGDPARPDGYFGLHFFSSGPPHDVWINLWQARPGARPRGSDYDVGLHHLALGAPSREAVERAYAYARAQGVELLDPPEARDYGPEYYSCYFRDPDGIKIEVASMKAT